MYSVELHLKNAAAKGQRVALAILGWQRWRIHIRIVCIIAWRSCQLRLVQLLSAQHLVLLILHDQHCPIHLQNSESVWP